jgi:hypothetical protein
VDVQVTAYARQYGQYFRHRPSQNDFVLVLFQTLDHVVEPLCVELFIIIIDNVRRFK